MLLEFKSANYKSFKDEFVFSLIPAPKQKGLDYSVMKTRAGKKVYRGLCSAVIYGPNASGKTNIIGAMDTFKAIVRRGNIRNDADEKIPNAASSFLGLIPNLTVKISKPVEFSISFIEKGLHVEYSLSFDLGTFLAKDHKRKILSETLKVNSNMIFTRAKGLEFGSFKAMQNFYANAVEHNANVAIDLANSNLEDEELFLTNGFKVMFSSKLVNIITDWLEKKFIVVYSGNLIRLLPHYIEPQKNYVYIDKTLNNAIKLFGLNSNELVYYKENDNNGVGLYSLLENDNEKKPIPADLFESYGTLRFANLYPMVLHALQTGSTLVVDEFDASIHPMAIMSIINIFHNDEINVNHAQLVFNTHNPIFLNANLYRRDEIKFVERNDEDHYSTHYSLSDFKTASKSGVRKNDIYMKNYFLERYGAFKDIDFTPFFEKLIGSSKGCRS